MAADIELVASTVDHIAPIANRMRRADVDEIYASSRRLPKEALEFSLRKSSLAMTALVNGQPEVMFGVGDLSVLSQVGAPWLLGTDAVTERYIAFLRGSVSWREQLLLRYQVLRNAVDDRNTASKRWLRWLGFSLSEPMPLGVDGEMFRLFEMRRADV